MNKRKQPLVDLPKDERFLDELFGTVVALSGRRDPAMTLSERHIMIYDENHAVLPPLYKDRLASQVSIEIPLAPVP